MKIAKQFAIIFFLFHLICLILFTVSCKPEKVDLCDTYRDYFDGDTQDVSFEDSLASKKHFDYIKGIISLNGNYYNGDPYLYDMIYKAKHTDTSLRSKITDLYYNYLEEYSNTIGLDYFLARYLILSDAVIKGTVIGKDNYSDSCLFFTTTYYVQVDSIIHSYFPIKEKDLIIVKSNLFGFVGGCINDERKKYFKSADHAYEYKLNEQSHFFLSRGLYLRQYYNQILSSNFKDQFCFNSFLLPINNEKLNLSFKSSNKKKLAKLSRIIKK